MKIAWFSPLAPQHTEIANSTERLRPALDRCFDVRYIAEYPEGFVEPASGVSYPYTLGYSLHELMPPLNLVDLPVYNLGNHPGFFSKTWFLSQAKPGVVVLHDLKLHHFFEGIYRAQFHDKPRYLEIMRAHYGQPGVDAGEAYWQQRLSIDHMAQHFPMTRWAIGNALAVVVHTTHARDVLSRLTDRPVWMLPLPYDAARRSEPRRMDGAEFTPERPARLIICGYLNVNRRVIEFLEALAGMDERSRFVVDIIGTVANLSDVLAVVSRCGLEARVHFHGHVTEEVLEDLLNRADLAINLRYPTMGEASASQLRIWDHALPSLVTRADGYAVMPPDTVFFVRPEHERQDIREHLRRFLQRPAHFRETGLRGRRYLLASHTPQHYAEALHEHLQELDGIRARRNRLEAADRIGRLLPWAANPSRTITEQTKHYAEEIAAMF